MPRIIALRRRLSQDDLDPDVPARRRESFHRRDTPRVAACRGIPPASYDGRASRLSLPGGVATPSRGCRSGPAPARGGRRRGLRKSCPPAPAPVPAPHGRPRSAARSRSPACAAPRRRAPARGRAMHRPGEPAAARIPGPPRSLLESWRSVPGPTALAPETLPDDQSGRLQAGYNSGHALPAEPGRFLDDTGRALPEHRWFPTACRTSCRNAPEWGSGGRRFKSGRPDQNKRRPCIDLRCRAFSRTSAASSAMNLFESPTKPGAVPPPPLTDSRLRDDLPKDAGARPAPATVAFPMRAIFRNLNNRLNPDSSRSRGTGRALS